MKEKEKIVKARSWLFILYPSAMVDNWKDIFSSFLVPSAISPLHDKDIIDETGESKKAHYHGIISFDNPTTISNVQSMIDSLYIEHAPQIIQCRSVRGAVRYFTHLDNPDKYQYSKNDIQFFNGFSVNDYLSSSEKTELLFEVFNLCDKENIYEYSDLIDYLRFNYEFDLFDICVNSKTLALKAYFDSKRNKELAKYSLKK